MQYNDVIPSELLNLCLNYYKSQKEYDTVTMNKVDPGVVLPDLVRVCKDILGNGIEYRSGNFYSHTQPYLPHTDYKTHLDNTLNIVIPLEFVGTLPSLVVFDQKWNLDSVTWCMHHKVQYYTTNTGVKGSPFEYPVEGLTGKGIEENLHKTYLSHYPSYTLFGLSGQAFPFIPGSAIVFDNRRIHCTSTFNGHKTGVSLRFKI
jgi:hypothetical protein